MMLTIYINFSFIPILSFSGGVTKDPFSTPSARIPRLPGTYVASPLVVAAGLGWGAPHTLELIDGKIKAAADTESFCRH